MGDIFKDDRFAKYLNDPRYRQIPKHERKVKIDKRFQSMFSDEKFKVKYTVDKRGRPVNETSTENLRKYYELESGGSSDESADGENDKEKNESVTASSTIEEPGRFVRIPQNAEGETFTVEEPGLFVRPPQGTQGETFTLEEPDLFGRPAQSAEGETFILEDLFVRPPPSNDGETAIIEELEHLVRPAQSDEVEPLVTLLQNDQLVRGKLDKKTKERLLDLEVDYARGEGVLATDSSSDEDSSENEDENDYEHEWGELDADAGTTDESTKSILVGYIEGGDMVNLVEETPLVTELHPKRQHFYDPIANVLYEIDDDICTEELASAEDATVALETCDGVGASTSHDVQNHDLEPSASFHETCVADSSLNKCSEQQLKNNGSEDDSDMDDDDDEGPFFPRFISRATRSFLELRNSSLERTPEHVPELSYVSLSLPHADLILPQDLLSDHPVDHEPSDLFAFVWTNFPTHQIPLNERREVFTETDCGPTRSLTTPYEAFTAIWNREFMDYIAEQTNIYAQQCTERKIREGTIKPTSRISHWHDTSADELYVFFALLLATGWCVRSDLKEYWTRDDLTACPNFRKYLSYNRFLLLCSCLHFVDNTTDVQYLTNAQAKIFKIAPVVEHLNSKFQSLYRLKQNIVLDDSLTQWKGWLNNKYIKNKAALEVKTYEVCEPQTGYLYKFKLHAGSDTNSEDRGEVTPFGSGTEASLVLDLLKGLENKGHTVWMASYHISPSLARVLKSLGFDCVGTLRSNCQDIPEQVSQLKKSDFAIGEISGCTSGDVDILIWRDHNLVQMISTYHIVDVHILHGKAVPIVVHDYNLCMADVDKKDQILSTYPIERKRTHVWYKKFFRRLLNASVLNAFILFKQSIAHTTMHRAFRKTLAAELLKNHFKDPKAGVKISTERKETYLRYRADGVPIIDSEVLQHFPQEYGLVAGTTRNEKIRRTCVICHKRQSYHCPACNVALCVDCNRIYHGSRENK